MGEIGIDPEPKGYQAESMEVQEEIFLAQLKCSTVEASGIDSLSACVGALVGVT